MKQQRNLIGPQQFEAMHALLIARELWTPKKAARTKVFVTGFRSGRDLVVRLGVEGEMDPFLRVFTSARIFARTRARHQRHLFMMHQLLGEVGYQCYLTMPNFIQGPRAKTAVQRIGQ